MTFKWRAWDFLENAAVHPHQRSTETSFCFFSCARRYREWFWKSRPVQLSLPKLPSRAIAAASRQVSEAEAKAMLHTHRAVPLHSTIYLSFVAHNWGRLQMAQLHRLYTVKSLFRCVNSCLLPSPGKRRDGQESPTNKPWFIKGEDSSGLISSLGNQARLNLLYFVTISVGRPVAVTGMLPITPIWTTAKRRVQQRQGSDCPLVFSPPCSVDRTGRHLFQRYA